MTKDPKRWSSEPGSPELGFMLRAAREQRPDAGALAGLRARVESSLGVSLGPASSAPSAVAPAATPRPPPASATRPFALPVSALVVAGGVLLGVHFFGERAGAPAPALEFSAAQPVAPAPEPSAAPLLRTEIARPAPAPAPASGNAHSRRPAPAASAERAPPSELDLVSRAGRILNVQPAQAWALANEHQQRYPAGALSEEREVIAIDALARLGNLPAARATRRAVHLVVSAIGTPAARRSGRETVSDRRGNSRKPHAPSTERVMMTRSNHRALLAAFALLTGCSSDLIVASDRCSDPPPHAYYPALAPDCTCRDQGVGVDASGTANPSDSAYTIATPSCHEVPQPVVRADKLDVLFVINNGATMADKQIIFAKSRPAFLSRLVNPRCVNSAGKAVAAQPATGADACPRGKREFQPVTDMHVGVITSSIGAHGGDLCDGDAGTEPNPNDRAELLPAVRPGLPSYEGSDFFSFDRAGEHGVSDVAGLVSDLQSTVLAVGVSGCQFQAPLEAMHRFLLEPAPPKAIRVVAGYPQSTGLNGELLQQRAAFLRPDSALAIVLLSDEDDCSITDRGGWAAADSAGLPPASSACLADPFDRCCRSCAADETTPPESCVALSDDSACAAYLRSAKPLPARDDALSLRCFNQKQRFGVDRLTSSSFYAADLASERIVDSDGVVDNPLFITNDGKADAAATRVSFAVIAGAPWQDLATADSLAPNHPLEYSTVDDLASIGRWPLLVDGRASGWLPLAPPTDPFMVASVEPRDPTLANPVTGGFIVTADSPDPQASPINGHEHQSPARANLQYACTFELPQPRECLPGDAQCACAPTATGSLDSLIADNSPLCQRPSGGAAETAQYYAGAYPGLRQLAVARSLGDRGVAASICPKTLDEAAPDYGYRPALDALIGGIALTLK